MRILDTLKQLLQFKGYATIAETARLSGKKQIDVLSCFNKNNHLLKVDKKKARVVGFIDCVAAQKEKAYSDGKTFKYGEDNYGTCKTILITNKEHAESLQKNLWCGGLGDCYLTQVIYAEDEQKVRALGYKHYDEWPCLELEKCWRE